MFYFEKQNNDFQFIYLKKCGKVIREPKRARFWGANGHRKWPISPFNLPSQNHIHIAKYLFSIRD